MPVETCRGSRNQKDRRAWRRVARRQAGRDTGEKGAVMDILQCFGCKSPPSAHAKHGTFSIYCRGNLCRCPSPGAGGIVGRGQTLEEAAAAWNNLQGQRADGLLCMHGLDWGKCELCAEHAALM